MLHSFVLYTRPPVDAFLIKIFGRIFAHKKLHKMIDCLSQTNISKINDPQKKHIYCYISSDLLS